MAFGFARDRSGKGMRMALSPRNSFKAISILVVFSFLVFFFRENLSYGGHKHAIGNSDLDFEEDYLRPNSPNIDANGFLHTNEAEGYCSRHGWKEYPHRQQRRKIYDLFMINSELDWLEIRLNELKNHVDYFVILEAATTFTGLPKPLILGGNGLNNFTEFKDQIIYHVLLDPDPKKVEEEKWTQWDHEKFQRNAMFEQVLPRLKDARAPNPGDVILVSDIDEIPRPASLTVLRNCEFPKRLTLRSRFYYYSFQWLHRGAEWAHPQATTYTPNATILPQDLRGGHGAGFFSKDKADLYNAAWHCSSCFATIEEMLLKMQSFSHVEYNEKRFRKKEWIVDHIRKGRDLWDRWGQWYLRIEGNRDVPSYVKGQEERFMYMLDRDGESAGFVDYVPGDAEEEEKR